MLALLPLLIKLAADYGPTLAGMLIGPKASEVTQTAIDVAKQVFGTDDPSTIQNAIEANPSLAQVFVAKIQAETERYKASLADVASARSQTVELAKIGNVIAWGAPIVSVIVVVGFITLLSLWLFKPPTSDAALLAVLNIMIGTLSTAFGAVVQYWLGSSAGSANKDQLLNNALVNAQSNTVKALGR